jgi:hypothetical protein
MEKRWLLTQWPQRGRLFGQVSSKSRFDRSRKVEQHGRTPLQLVPVFQMWGICQGPCKQQKGTKKKKKVAQVRPTVPSVPWEGLRTQARHGSALVLSTSGADRNAGLGGELRPIGWERRLRGLD